MSEFPYTSFKGVTKLSQALLMEEIEHNLRMFLRWAFLQIGGWSNVEIGDSTIFGGSFDTLTPIHHPNYDDYTVYETPRKDLVYEHTAEFESTSPIEIAGVYVNNTLYASNHATYGHSIDYTNGYVIFNSALDESDVVKMEYSYRSISVEIAEESAVWRELQFGSLRPDDDHSSNPDKGSWAAIPALKRQQMPCVIIECVPKRNQTGWQLGSQTLNIKQDVLFHIISEQRNMRNRLVDILSFEQDHTIWMINTDSLVGSTDWPIRFDGTLNSSGLDYPSLVEKYKWLRLSFIKNTATEIRGFDPSLYLGTIRSTVEVIYTKD
jgi:hypothetical protein